MALSCATKASGSGVHKGQGSGDVAELLMQTKWDFKANVLASTASTASGPSRVLSGINGYQIRRGLGRVVLADGGRLVLHPDPCSICRVDD